MKVFGACFFLALWTPVLTLIVSDVQGVSLGEILTAMPSVLMVFAATAALVLGICFLGVEFYGRWDEWRELYTRWRCRWPRAWRQ